MATFPTARTALLGHPATPGYTPSKRDLVMVLEQIEGMATSGIKGYHGSFADLAASESPVTGDYRVLLASDGGVYRYNGSAWVQVAPLPAGLQNLTDEGGLALAVAEAEAWATGTLPGGADTKSAREWAVAAQAAENTIVKPRGAWATATAYVVGDIVRPGTPAGVYICLVAHTAAAAFSTDLTAERWELFLDDGADGDVPGSRLISSGTGLTGGGDLTANRTLALTGMALAVHELSTNGLIARTGAGTAAARTIVGGGAATVTNGNGVSGNPTIDVPQLTQVQAEDDTSTVFGAVSGQRLAQAVAANAVTVTTSAVLTATAGATYGAVGTYAMLATSNDTEELVAGGTIAGSSLVPIGVRGVTVSTGVVVTGTTAPAGTWRAMGYKPARPDNNANNRELTLFLRIS